MVVKMLLNINNETAKKRSQAVILNLMVRYERMFFKTISAALKSQFSEAAKFVASGNEDIDQAIINRTFLYKKSFEVNYRRIINFFGKMLLDEVEELSKSFNNREMKYEVKTFFEEFLSIMKRWSIFHIGEQIKRVNRTTIRVVKNIITKGRSDGLSSVEIARNIRKKSKITNKARSENIARTETHTTAQRSMNEAMKTTRLKYEKEWMTAGDERVRGGSKGFNHRIANGERVAQEEFFEKTGESLEYPGDPAGSAGNICRCRCNTLFHTVAVAIFRAARRHIQRKAAA